MVQGAFSDVVIVDTISPCICDTAFLPSHIYPIPQYTDIHLQHKIPEMSQDTGEVAPVAQEKVNTDIVTLTRFLTEEQSKHKEATGDFTYVL